MEDEGSTRYFDIEEFDWSCDVASVCVALVPSAEAVLMTAPSSVDCGALARLAKASGTSGVTE